MELDALVIGRNELAKWQKLNSKKYENFSRSIKRSSLIGNEEEKDAEELEFERK